MRWMMAAVLALAPAVPVAARAQVRADTGSFTMRDFRFASGEVLSELRIHYRTLGHRRTAPGGRVVNAVSKPSDGLRARLPRYVYEDMVTAEYRLVTEGLHVDHLHLVMGTSMGCMHSWLWAVRWPDFMDGIVPIACIPTQIIGRNRDSADAYITSWVRARMETTDANDLLYAVESSHEYDPSGALERVTAPVLAINSADDEINPPELSTHSMPVVCKSYLVDFLSRIRLERQE